MIGNIQGRFPLELNIAIGRERFHVDDELDEALDTCVEDLGGIL